MGHGLLPPGFALPAIIFSLCCTIFTFLAGLGLLTQNSPTSQRKITSYIIFLITLLSHSFLTIKYRNMVGEGGARGRGYIYMYS